MNVSEQIHCSGFKICFWLAFELKFQEIYTINQAFEP